MKVSQLQEILTVDSDHPKSEFITILSAFSPVSSFELNRPIANSSAKVKDGSLYQSSCFAVPRASEHRYFWFLSRLKHLIFLLPLIATTLVQATALNWETIGAHRRAAVQPGTQSKEIGFRLLAARSSGVLFTNVLTDESAKQFQNLMNGAGVAAGDLNSDGFTDLYFCSRTGPNALFLNRGNLQFTNYTALSGAACTNQWSSGCLLADIDGDQDLDLFVGSFDGPNALLINQGNGTFSSSPHSAAIQTQLGSTSMAMGDLDGDGDLDLYLCHFAKLAILRDGAMISVRTINGRPTVTGRYANRVKIIDGLMYELGESDVVFRNLGGGKFERVPWNEMFVDEHGSPSSPLPDFGLAVQIRDINGDHLPDIYVCNDFQTPDRLWYNIGNGKFKAASLLSLRNMSSASMGVDFADIDRDGLDDFITVEMLNSDPLHHIRQSNPRAPVKRIPSMFEYREETTRNNLYLNRGDGTYTDIALMAGVAASDWSWTPIFLDVDLDGYEDLLISNGHMRDVNDLDIAASAPKQSGQFISATKSILDRYPPLRPPKRAFRNLRNAHFAPAPEWGFDSKAMAHGMCLADLDNDADMDVILNTLNDAPLIYINEAKAPRIGVRLVGRAPNTRGIGARIKVEGGPVVQTQEMLAGGRYLSSDDPMRVFAAGSTATKLNVEVKWSDNSITKLEDVEPNFIYEIHQPSDLSNRSAQVAATTKLTLNERKWYSELATPTNTLVHSEPAFDDFSNHPSLPWKLSQQGPGLAFIDVNGDGIDELLQSNGLGGNLNLVQFDQPSSTKISTLKLTPLSSPNEDDLLGLTTWTVGEKTLVVASQSAYENLASSGGIVATLFNKNLLPEKSWKYTNEVRGIGPVALTDFDGRGNLVLFAGSGHGSGQYPDQSPPRIFKLAATLDSLRIDLELTKALSNVGIIQSAIWSDLNGDHLPDLVLTEEWGPIRLFLNQQGSLVESTEQWGLNGKNGLWTGITSGDFNGDGRMDLVVGNWGLNTQFNAFHANKHSLHYGDFAGLGQNQIVETSYYGTNQLPSPRRSLDSLGAWIPGLKEQFKSHVHFSTNYVSTWLDHWKVNPKSKEIGTLTTSVFLNLGNRFEEIPLPALAQVAPVFGVAVADADGDGRQDIFLAQNFFAVRSEDTRYDAGRGQWLRGLGDGRFELVPGHVSGIAVYGEQRGCALSDLNQDGKLDLAVSQNGGHTRIFLNQTSHTGWRIKLNGPDHNRNGYGAKMRLRSKDKFGPTYELLAGSGWLSQNSPITILHRPHSIPSNEALELEVHWPGGKTTSLPLPTTPSLVTVRH